MRSDSYRALETSAISLLIAMESNHACRHRGRVIKELGLRRADLVITTKIFWGPRGGHHGGGLSRKQ